MLSDFPVVWEIACLELGVHQFPVDADFEAAAIRGNEYKLLDLILQVGDEFVGQTDRFRFVVSNLAVDDFDFHESPLSVEFPATRSSIEAAPVSLAALR